MAQADKYFWQQAFAALEDVCRDRRSELGRNLVDDFLFSFDLRENEKSAWQFADKVLEECDYLYGRSTRLGDKELYEAVDSVIMNVLAKLEREERGSRRENRPRERDRPSRRSRRDRGDEGEELFGSSSRTTRQREEPRAEREPEPRAEAPVETPAPKKAATVEDIMKAEGAFYSPFDLLTDHKLPDAPDIIKGNVDNYTRVLMDQWCMHLDETVHTFQFGDKIDIACYPGAAHLGQNTTFDQVRDYFQYAPKALRYNLWLTKLRTHRFRTLAIGLKEFEDIRLSVLNKADGPLTFDFVEKALSQFRKEAYSLIAEYLREKLSVALFTYLRSRDVIDHYIKIKSFDDMKDVVDPNLKIALAEDPAWKSTLEHIQDTIFGTFFKTTPINRTAIDETFPMADYLRCHGVRPETDCDIADQYQFASANPEQRQVFLDSVNKSMVFWKEPVDVIMTNVLTHGTMRRMTRDPSSVDVATRPDLLALNTILSSAARVNARHCVPTEIYGILYKNEASKYMRQMDVVLPMSIQGNASIYTVASDKHVIGL